MCFRKKKIKEEKPQIPYDENREQYLNPTDNVKPVAEGEYYMDYRLSDIFEDYGYYIEWIRLIYKEGDSKVALKPQIFFRTMGYHKGIYFYSPLFDIEKDRFTRPGRFIAPGYKDVAVGYFDDLIIRYIEDDYAHPFWISGKIMDSEMWMNLSDFER